MAMDNMQAIFEVGRIEQIMTYIVKRPTYIFTFLDLRRNLSIHTKRHDLFSNHPSQFEASASQDQHSV
jgi:hypothetical protein